MKFTKSYKEFETPIEFKGFKAIGYFPYCQARLIGNLVAVPRSVYNHIEVEIKEKYNDNKYVVVFQKTEDFGASNFCIWFKDGWAMIGSWNQLEIGFY